MLPPTRLIIISLTLYFVFPLQIKNGTVWHLYCYYCTFTAVDTNGSDDYADDVCSLNEETECDVPPSFEDNWLVDPDVPLIEQE